MPRPEQLRPLTAASNIRAGIALTLDWIGIAALFTVAMIFPNPWVWAVCFFGMARQQLALAILMHDGSHRRLFKTPAWNDRLCQFFCAAPLFFSMYSYQKLHLKHHRDPLAPDDPDLSLIGGYPIPWTSFARKLLRDASGLSYYKFIRYFIHMARQSPGTQRPTTKPEREVGPVELKAQAGGSKLSLPAIAASIILVNMVLWAVLFALGHGWFFLFLWVLPAITFLQVLLRIRGIAEHAGYVQGPDQRLNARTVINPIQTFIFAPHHVNFHIEHHAYPAVPFYNLPKLHKLMKDEGLLPDSNVYHGYGQVLAELIS